MNLPQTEPRLFRTIPGGRLKQHIVRIALGLLVVLVFVGHVVGMPTRATHRLHQPARQHHLRLPAALTMPGTPDDRIVILDIDDAAWTPSAGRWPGAATRSLHCCKSSRQVRVLIVGWTSYSPSPMRVPSAGAREAGRDPAEERRDVPVALKELRADLDYDAKFSNFLRGRR